MIPVFKPLIEKEEIAATTHALEVGWLGMGSFVNKFEEGVKAFLEIKDDRHVVSVSTGHAALHLGLLIAGVGPGDEVITPSFNNIADFQAILACGAQPVFCDISEKTLCIDLEKAEALVTEKTKVIIVMDYDCFLCDHDAVQAFAEKHGIRVLHDAAHSFGSLYKGKKIGSFSDICMFSFDPVKTITCIDGGALIVRSQEEVTRLHSMRLVGMGQPASVMYQNKRAWTYHVTELGFRYHMSNVHAALGLAQLAKMDIISSTRREACRYYNEHLSDISEVIVPDTDFEGITPFLYYVRVPANRRDDFRSTLMANGVDVGIHWQPGHWFELFKGTPRGPLDVTEKIGHEIVSLPLHSCMSKADLDKVISEIRSFFKK